MRKPYSVLAVIGAVVISGTTSLLVGQSPSSVALDKIAGEYLGSSGAMQGNHLQLNTDRTWVAVTKGGRRSSGTFTIEGNKLMIVGKGIPLQALILQNDNILDDPDGSTWVRQSVAPAAVSQLPPPPQALHFPSIYLSTQTPADQLRLNADNSFSLLEAGQPYRGTFAINGDTLEITIPATNTKTKMTIRESNLVDPNGQTWDLQTAPAPNVTSPSVLRNEDVIKLAKVGIDDSIIIAKIGSSKCQFDTSVDALIQLKESGVTAAVLKAMVGAQTMNTTPPSTSAKTVTEATKATAQLADSPNKQFEFYYRSGKFGDYILLYANGTFDLGAGPGSHDHGTYTVDGSAITFSPSSTPGRKYRLLSNPPGSNRMEAGKIVEPDGSFWAPLVSNNAAVPPPAAAAAPPVAPQPSSPCPDIDYLGVIQAVTGGGQMAGTNAYGGRVRNRASYTKEVDFAWIMNGRAETGTFRVPAGQFIDVNLGQGPAPPTNVRVVGCR